MKSSSAFLSLTLLLLCISSALGVACKESDYKQYFSDCNSKEETRTVTIYLPSNCDNVQSRTNPVLSIYSTLPTFTIPCSTKCSSGEYVFYDVMKTEPICSKCPKDTYSQGGDFKISGNWNQETIKKNFAINCYSIDSFSFKKNEDCTQFAVSNDRSTMSSGELIGQQIKYLFEMIYFFKSKNNGRVIIRLKKDTFNENGFNNGDLKLFFDYEQISENNSSDSSLKTVYHDFGPGEHELVIFYNYYKIDDKSLKLYIQSFEVIGIEDASYHCEKCMNSISVGGSEQCITCKDNHFYDKKLQECKECPADEFSVSNSIYDTSCNKRRECNEYDFELSKANDQCIDAKRTVELSLIKPSYCLFDKTASVVTKEIQCIDQDNTGASNLKCPEGKGLFTQYQMDISSKKIDELFEYNNGWSSNGRKLFIGRYVSEITEKVLRLTIKKKSSSSLAKITFEAQLNQNEFFKIKINHELVKAYSNVNKIESIEVTLNEFNNKLEFIYAKTVNGLTLDNPISITKIELFGTDLSTNSICNQCPQNYISQSDSNTCVKCKENKIPNDNQTECVSCSNGISQIIEGKLQCSNCPSFTSFKWEKCVLNEVIHQSEEKLKFNLAPMKDWLRKLCADQSGVLCYENAFIGPISSKSSSNSSPHDIFFISLFEPKGIEIYDFDYDDVANIIKEGHIFGLFSVNKPILSNSSDDDANNDGDINTKNNNDDIFLEHNITYQNTKTKKNIAKAIQTVHLLGQSVSPSKRLGAIIEYEQGDTCLSDPSKKYKAYVYLKCEKYQISAPKIINTFDKDCTIIFEWGSPYLCKNCLTKEISNFEKGTCKNNQRQIIFSSNDECLIFNATNPKFLGYDKEYNDLLLNKTNIVFQLVVDQKGKQRDLDVVEVKNDESVSFPFDYIENRTYYEKCGFLDNLEGSWKKYLLIIPIVYAITCVLVIFYCCKYRKIKNEYERLRNSDVNHQDISKDNKSIVTKQEKNIEINTS